MVGQAASRAGGIERVTPDGARLIGLALEEYVKNLVSKAIHAASHRNIQFKDNEHREKVNDVKTQFKLLQGMFRLENSRIFLCLMRRSNQFMRRCFLMQSAMIQDK